jgi:5'(3')-deoxyribonucleotidase
MVCTKIPSKNPYAAAEKLIWMSKHLHILHDRVIITPDKGCIGTKRDYLIDDHPEWANAHNFEGTILKFTKTFGWPQILEYFADLEPGLL